MSRLILVRHGESEANIVGSLDTRVPGPPLTELGRKQAAELVQALADHEVQAVWSSSMTRALETAGPLAEALGVEVRIHPDLREVDVGDLSDRRDTEAHDLLDDIMGGWMLRGELELRCPGGECGADLVARVEAVFHEVIADLDGDGTAVVVAHGAALRTTLLGLCDLDAAFVLSHHLPNAGYVVVDVADGEYVCRSWAGLAPKLFVS